MPLTSEQLDKINARMRNAARPRQSPEPWFYVVLRRDINLDDEVCAPYILFKHNPDRTSCRCIDFDLLGVKRDVFVAMNKLSIKMSRELWYKDTKWDAVTQYRAIWFSVVVKALKPAGRPLFSATPRINPEVADNLDTSQLIFLHLWKSAPWPLDRIREMIHDGGGLHVPHQELRMMLPSPRVKEALIKDTQLMVEIALKVDDLDIMTLANDDTTAKE
ncbi:hypothetical protein BJ170DRAFT_694557 [Xylariales sp. AK1849]|nr:hypothetical protein BJ170DRAFT_694557 [Xylariales sp. AK1849]